MWPRSGCDDSQASKLFGMVGRSQVKLTRCCRQSPKAGARELGVRRHPCGKLCGRRRLLLHTWHFGIDAGPARRTRRPDRHCRACMIRIIEAANPNEDQVRSRLCLAEQRCTARGTKSPMHSVAAVRKAREVSRLSHYLECGRAKASSNRSAARPQILAVAAPANARRDRRLVTLPTNCTAKAPASQRHRNLQGQEVRLRRMANRTLRGQPLVAETS